MKSFVYIALCVFSSVANSQTEQDIDAFFSIEKNKIILEKITASGKANLALEQYSVMCSNPETTFKNCECIADKYKSVPIKYVVYELLEKYKDYRSLELAKGSENYAKVKEEVSNRRSVLDNFDEQFVSECKSENKI